MKAFWKRTLSVLAAAGLIAAALAGCQGKDGGSSANGEGDGTDFSSGGQAMGRYLEEETAMPEGLVTPLDMVKLQDGKVRILGMDENGKYLRWDSGDGGESWEKTGELPEDKFGENGIWLGDAALSPTGEGFLCSYGEDGSMSYYYMTAQMQTEEVHIDLEEIDPGEEQEGSFQMEDDLSASEEKETKDTGAGSDTEEKTESDREERAENDTKETVESDAAESDAEKDEEKALTVSEDGQGEILYNTYEMNISNSLAEVKFSSDGTLFVSDYNNKLYRLNPETGELEAEIASGVQMFEIVGDRIFVEDASSAVALYDAKTGEAAEQDQMLMDAIKEAGGMSSFVAGMKNILFLEGEEDSVYYCNRQGLYRHIFGGTVNEQLIDGNLNSLGSPDTGLTAMCAVNDGAFLILVSQSDGESKLLKYTYSKDTPSRPSKELKLYALNDSDEIRQAISMFQKENADYYINFEVGLGGEDGITASDALKTLNTEIMAGKGPDILILDGMPVQSYVEKGILEDLTDIFNGLKEGDGCFEQIAGTYGTENGICAIPSRFKVPMIEGSQDVLDSSGDLRTFADKIVELRKKDAEISGIVETSSPEILTEKIYQSYSPALIKADGSLDEQKAEEFYTQLKRIYDTGRYSEEDLENVMYSVQAVGALQWTELSMGSMELLEGRIKANMGILGDISAFNQVMAVNEKQGLSYELLSLAGKKVYCPGTILGISSRSGQKEDAKKFLAYILGKEVQSMNQGGGFPVNKKAYEEMAANPGNEEVMVGYTSWDGDTSTEEMTYLSIRWAGEEAFASLRKKLDSLDTPCLIDTVLGDAVMEQAVKYLKGECTAEEAVSNLVQKVNLYLAE